MTIARLVLLIGKRAERVPSQAGKESLEIRYHSSRLGHPQQVP